MEMAGEIAIGICAVRERARWAFWDQTAHLVADTYVAAVQAEGAHALLLPVDGRRPEALLDRVDGLMVIGGADLDPELLRRGPVRAHGEDLPRARRVRAGAHAGGAPRSGLPFLGICRGMQLLNVALGGTLDQHLVGEDGVPSAPPRDRHLRRHASTRSTCSRDRSPRRRWASRCTRCAATTTRPSTGCGEGLLVSGRARDGVAEAIEPADGGGWALGVQWHPEAGERRELFRRVLPCGGGGTSAETAAVRARTIPSPRRDKLVQPPYRAAPIRRAPASTSDADHVRALVLLRVPQHAQRVGLVGQLDRLDDVVLGRPADRRSAPRRARRRPGGGAT